MIFQHTWEKVLSGEATQTRRKVSPGQTYWHWTRPVILDLRGHHLYRTRNVYAVQPSYDKGAVCHIRLTDVHDAEDVRNISAEDAIAEGFDSPAQFLALWASMYDRQAHKTLGDAGNIRFHAGVPYGSESVTRMCSFLATRPDEPYRAWVLVFRLTERSGITG